MRLKLRAIIDSAARNVLGMKRPPPCTGSIGNAQKFAGKDHQKNYICSVICPFLQQLPHSVSVISETARQRFHMPAGVYTNKSFHLFTTRMPRTSESQTTTETGPLSEALLINAALLTLLCR